jgi:hypothetical protein
MDGIVGLIVLLGLMFLFFLLGRELICWYFKINKTVELLEHKTKRTVDTIKYESDYLTTLIIYFFTIYNQYLDRIL